jgi:hypothetical protein
MRRPAHIAERSRPSAAADESPLHPGHPLLRTTDALERVARQSLVVAAMLTGSVIGDLDRQRWGLPLALSSAVVLAILSLTALGLRYRRRDRAIDLILEGREHVQIAAVQHERRRLMSERARTGLARSFEDVINESRRTGPQMRASRPLFHLWVVRESSKELSELVSLLASHHTSVQGLARAERLIAGGTSPLYGDDAGALRAEIRRINRLLSP